MLPNIVKINPIQKFLPESIARRPILLSFLDRIRRRLGIGKPEEIKKEAIPIENTEPPPEDEWSGINAEKQREYPQSLQDYPSGFRHGYSNEDKN